IKTVTSWSAGLAVAVAPCASLCARDAGRSDIAASNKAHIPDEAIQPGGNHEYRYCSTAVQRHVEARGVDDDITRRERQGGIEKNVAIKLQTDGFPVGGVQQGLVNGVSRRAGDNGSMSARKRQRKHQYDQQ